MSKSNIINNVPVMWVYHDKPDNFGKLNVTVKLTEEVAKVLEAQGLKIKDKDGNLTYSFSKPPVSRKGEKNSMPFFTRTGEPFTGMIPNETSCDIQYRIFDWEYAGKKGKKGYFIAAKINDDVMEGGTGLTFEEKAALVSDDPF